jgi:DNA-binding NarL/FixJ family response regulator
MLVEDHAAFRQSLASLLSQEPDLEVVAQAGSLAQARQMLDTSLDVAVLDLSLPDGDGRDLIGELRRRHSGISILVLSVMLGPSHQADEVEATGAAAYGTDLCPLSSVPPSEDPLVREGLRRPRRWLRL